MTTMTPTPTDQIVYLGRGMSDETKSHFHVALVPFMRGLTALCGTPLFDARPTRLGRALHAVACSESRTRLTTSVGVPVADEPDRRRPPL